MFITTLGRYITPSWMKESSGADNYFWCQNEFLKTRRIDVEGELRWMFASAIAANTIVERADELNVSGLLFGQMTFR